MLIPRRFLTTVWAERQRRIKQNSGLYYCITKHPENGEVVLDYAVRPVCSITTQGSCLLYLFVCLFFILILCLRSMGLKNMSKYKLFWLLITLTAKHLNHSFSLKKLCSIVSSFCYIQKLELLDL